MKLTTFHIINNSVEITNTQNGKNMKVFGYMKSQILYSTHLIVDNYVVPLEYFHNSSKIA